jgi:hypothetical protein
MKLAGTIASMGQAAARLAVALALVLFALAPAFDAAACAGDEDIHVTAAHGSTLTATAQLHSHDAGAADVEGLCAHGHCHHAAAAWPLREPAAEPVRLTVTVGRPGLTRLPPSRDPTNLERPPRA